MKSLAEYLLNRDLIPVGGSAGGILKRRLKQRHTVNVCLDMGALNHRELGKGMGDLGTKVLRKWKVYANSSDGYWN